MMLLFLSIGLFLTMVLGYLLIPKGNLLHELLHLPNFWWNLSKLDTTKLQSTRLNYGDHSRQYFLFIPPAAKQENPKRLIVYFHGGGWAFGKPENFKGSILPFHEAGYPVIMPSVRRTPFYNCFDIRKDLNQLLLSILAFQKQQGWQHQKLIVGGMSSGGNLAALLCFDRRALAKIQQDQALFAGLLAVGAPLEINKMFYSPVLYAFAGLRGSQQFKLANPVEHLAQSDPISVLAVHGDRDGMVSYQSALAFNQRLTERHPDKLQFVALPKGTHLEAASWGHQNDALSGEIMSWLRKL